MVLRQKSFLKRIVSAKELLAVAAASSVLYSWFFKFKSCFFPWGKKKKNLFEFSAVLYTWLNWGAYYLVNYRITFFNVISSEFSPYTITNRVHNRNISA